MKRGARDGLAFAVVHCLVAHFAFLPLIHNPPKHLDIINNV